jgi:uncharacterized Zn-binding protein involved in type VI secretion
MPAVARRGDRGVPHCSGYTIANGSNDVNINGRPAARVGDSSTGHLRPGGRNCVGHTASISRGSNTVNVNGRAIARIGDPLAGCTSVGQGSPDVFAG